MTKVARAGQMGLVFPAPEMKFGWGGKRKGAGRPRKKGLGKVWHRGRPVHDRSKPVHVTMRVVDGLGSLRAKKVSSAVGGAIRKGREREGFRIIAFSIQSNHLHFIVEGEGHSTLAAGIKGLAVRLARAINKAFDRTGTVFPDRYHARELTCPLAVRNALVYVYANFKHHDDNLDLIDPHSSARWFTGFTTQLPPQATPSPVAPAKTWLASTGWKRHGLISVFEAPADYHRPKRRPELPNPLSWA